MLPFPINRRYNYPKISATTFKTGRIYHAPTGDLPSVTTILNILPKDGLIEWRNRIGDEAADEIIEEACRIGTTMHDRLEGYVSSYLQGRPNIEPKTEEDKIAYYMADNIRRYALIDIDEIWGIEEGLYCEELYAGRTDLIAVYRGKSAIIDYKSSRLWKRPEWIENYKMQIAAYNLCHKTMFGEGMETGVILIALRPGSKSNQLVQKFVLDKNQLDEYEDKWLETVQKYYDIHSSTN